VQTKIQGGIATDSDGRVWDTGSGAVLKPATGTTTTTPETATITTTTTTPETATITTTTTTPETATITTPTTTPDSTNSIAPQTLSIKVSIPDSLAVEQALAVMKALDKESQLVTKIEKSKKTSVSINTEFSNSLIQFTAVKKGSKTISFAVLTNENGDAKLNMKRNLSGFTVSLKAGTVTLDKDKVGNK
jgi:hypothetical protein